MAKYRNPTIEISMNGLTDYEKMLLSIEPAVVDKQLESLRNVTKNVIDKIKNNIPSNWKLRESIFGYIAYYNDSDTFFMAAGVGDSEIGPYPNYGHAIDEPYESPGRYGYWQEWGWIPEQHRENMTQEYLQGRTRYDGTARSHNQKVSVMKIRTIPKKFVDSIRKEAREEAVRELSSAFESAVKEVLNNNSRTLSPDDFNRSISNNNSKKHPEVREVIR
jgi:ribosomal protein S20